MIPARVDATARMSRLTLLFILLGGVSLIDQLRNVFFSRKNIAGMKAARDIGGLIRLLNHQNSDVQYEAAEALGDIGDSGAVEPLISALKNDEFSGVRWKAAEALSKIGAPSVEGLIGALRHPDDDVRWKAAIALGEIGDPRAIEPLLLLLCDDDRFVRGRAAHALGMIGKPAVGHLIRALKEGDVGTRWGAALALGKTKNLIAVEPLILALADEQVMVRGEAAAALASIGTPALGPLLNFLKSTKGQTRVEVVTALGELQSAEAIGPLVQLLDNAGDEERQAIADALDAILIPAVEPLVRRIRDGNKKNEVKTRSGGDNGAAE